MAAKLTIVVLLIFGLASCSKKMLPPAQEKIVIKDSIIEREKIEYRDTTIFLPGDTTEISVAIPCPDVVIDTTAKKGRLNLSVKSDGRGNVKVNCNSDSLNLVIDSLKTVIKEKESYHSNYTEKKIPYAVEVIKYKIPGWCWWVLLYAIGLTVWTFRKPFKVLIKAAIKLWT